MKILYEIKQKKLYKYDGFKSFNEFIKPFVIAKTQAYLYLKVYKKVLEGVISIDKIKELGFVAIYQYIQKQESLGIDIKQDNIDQDYNENIPIRILVKDKELYKFCKQDTKRVYFILERLFKDKQDILLDFISQYENSKKNKNKD